MTQIIFHHDSLKLPKATKDLIPVQLYNIDGRKRGDICTIGSPILDEVRRLELKISDSVFDLLSISLAVTAADTFVKRDNCTDGWIREFDISIPLIDPKPWIKIKKKLEKTLGFLSGDIWSFKFLNGGLEAPIPRKRRKGARLIEVKGLDSVSLFSGGLDSAIGVIDILHQNNKPLLVSHKYKGDKSKQDAIANKIKGSFSRFSINAHPLISKERQGQTDISMRTRSFNFLAFAAVGASVVQTVNKLSRIKIYVPENGYISINPPLTPRRIGSLSTRTTHPYYLKSIQEIFNSVGFKFDIKNPFQFKTKGEMVASCLDRPVLQTIINDTVSCSHWKRANQQCGRCMPCIIRRAAIYKGQLKEVDNYKEGKLTDVMNDNKIRDDVFALLIAIDKTSSANIGKWIINSGPLPDVDFNKYKSMIENGLNEVKAFFIKEKIL